MDSIADIALPKILIVDDKKENLFSLNAILESDQATVYQAASAGEALDLAGKHEFAVIFSDVQMPGVSGYELVERLRMQPKTASTPVIFVTAVNRSEQNVHRGYAAGAIDYLLKPLDPEVVRAKAEASCTLYNHRRLIERQKNELQQLNARLKEMNRRLERFAYTAAHDLKSPLANILMLCNGIELAMKDKMDANIQWMLANIHAAASDLCGLVNGILDYHRSDRLLEEARTETDFTALCHEVIKLLTTDGKIKFNLPEKPLLLQLNRVAMKQILLNLFSNAIKYNDKELIEITVRVRQQKAYNHFTVSDNGPGISKEDQEDVFDLFKVLSLGENTVGAHGIGLATVKKLIEKQAGEMKVESEKGKGFTLHFRLPS